MAEQDREIVPVRRPMRDSFDPQDLDQPSCIAFQPNIEGTCMLSPQLLNMLPHFNGESLKEDPYAHIQEFFDICKTQHIRGLSADEIKLLLFPFSLKGDAKKWLRSLPANSITTWGQLAKKFIKKFFPAHKKKQLKREIQSFVQRDGDSFHEAWDHFNKLLVNCPNHNLPGDEQVQAFYEGLNDSNKAIVDSACNGMLMKMSDEEAIAMYEELAENSQQFNTRGRQAKRNTYAISANDGMQAEMAAMNKNIAALVKTLSPQSSQQALKSDVCAICSENDHATNLCPMTSFSDKEQVNFVGQGGYSSKHNPYSNTYNPGWRDHPNFSYANQRNVLNSSQGNTQLQGTAPGFSELKKSSLEDSIAALAQSQLAFQQSTQVFQQQTQAAIQTTQASLQKLEIQVGQLASAVNEREKGKFPSQPIANPKGAYEISSSSNHHQSHEQVKSIATLKSGTQMDNKVQRAKEDRETNLKKNAAVDVKCKNAQVNSPKPPFPQALIMPKKDNNFSEIMELFKKVHINIPLLEAIGQIPSYAKFLKGLCSHKRKLKGEEKVFLTKKLSDIYLRKNPSKLKDPGIPTLSCAIGSHKFEEALVDHGASVNLMPYSVYVELGLGELKRSPITLEFADGSVKKSCGVIEDVLMQIDKFYYPMDFIVLDTGPVRYSSTEIPIILGRPFLATAKANIQCDTGVLTLCFGDMKAKFNL